MSQKEMPEDEMSFSKMRRTKCVVFQNAEDEMCRFPKCGGRNVAGPVSPDFRIVD